MTKSCIRETKGMASRFDENPMRLQDLTQLEGFEKVFLEVMLPEAVKEEPPSPSRSETEIYEMGGRTLKGKAHDPQNNQLEEVRKLKYMDQATDQLNEEVLKYKEYPKRIFQQYPKLVSNEMLLIDTMPEERNKKGQKIVYEFNKEHCLTRPMTANQCSAIIKENKRREIFEKNQKIDPNPDRIIFRKGTPKSGTDQ